MYSSGGHFSDLLRLPEYLARDVDLARFDFIPEDQEEIQGKHYGHNGYEGESPFDPASEAHRNVVIRKNAQHDGVAAARGRGAGPAHVRGEGQQQQQCNGKMPVVLQARSADCGHVDQHQDGCDKGHQGMRGKERRGHRKQGREDKDKPSNRGACAQQQDADAAVESGLADGHGKRQNAEDEEDGIFGVGLGDQVGRKNVEEIHERAHEQGGKSERDGAGGPEKRRYNQNADHDFGAEGDLFRTQWRLGDGPVVIDGLLVYAGPVAVMFGDGLAGLHFPVIGITGNGLAKLAGLRGG